MGDHDESFVLPLAEGIDDFTHHLTVHEIETVERFIENEQRRVFYKCTCKKNKTLFSAGDMQEGAVGKFTDAKDIHPEETLLTL